MMTLLYTSIQLRAQINFSLKCEERILTILQNEFALRWLDWMMWVQSYINHLCLKRFEKPWPFLSIYESTLKCLFNILQAECKIKLKRFFVASRPPSLMINPQWQSRKYESYLTYNDSGSDGLHLPSFGTPGHGIHPPTLAAHIPPRWLVIDDILFVFNLM